MRRTKLDLLNRAGGDVVVLGLVFLCLAFPATAQDGSRLPRSGRALYMVSCAACHGADGRGVTQSQVGFDVPLPDFTDCDFASREPYADWAVVAQLGGPSRGFSDHMPAFQGVLTVEQTVMILDHIRTFCRDASWPSGELNLPKPLVTEKAFPEDEAVFTATVDAEDTESVMGEIVYEQRIGPRNQVEIVVPFGWTEVEAAGGETDWGSGIGDIAVGLKRALYDNLDKGTIFSATAEMILPTGDEARGYGKGTFVFEPFLAYGQILPLDAFLHAQTGLELPFDTDQASKEAFVRLALGRSFNLTYGGRTWSPMVELLGSRELEEGAEFTWDTVPQMQVTLNTRQHIMLCFGARIPTTNTEGRNTQAIVYVLLDWFDGSLFEGW